MTGSRAHRDALDPRLLEAYDCGGTSPTSTPRASLRAPHAENEDPAPPGPPYSRCSRMVFNQRVDNASAVPIVVVNRFG